MTTLLKGVEGISSLVGKHLGYSSYVPVEQSRIDLFAEVSGDRQWIHVDVDRAKTGPYGTTIAHGLLTLSMMSLMAKDVFKFDGFKMGVNYGYAKIRFPAPVRCGSNLRLGAKVLSREELKDGVQTIIELTIEVESQPKPGCVAEMIFRHFL